jgi:paraquat-inducible protein B
MPNENNLNQLPQATLERPKRFRLSVVWIIPILAAVIAIGIAVQRILNEGPTITIVFKVAEGVEAGKTFLKYKDVTVGTVSAVQLSDDFTKVVVKAKIAKYAAGLMVDDTTFWIVAPRVTLSGISGLGTLLSGNYIGLAPGKATRHRHEYTGLDVPPPITDQPGRLFVLKADSLGSVGIGAPVYYRSLSVGQVVEYNLSSDGKAIDIKVFVDAPYDKYVTSEVRFWNASGINVSAGADGVQVHTESLVAVLVGGIAFDTRGFGVAGE